MKYLVSICGLLFFVFSADAQKENRGIQRTESHDSLKGKTYAIIIGISNYKKVVPSLKYAHKDALAFQNFLVNEGGVARDNIRTFLNDSATKWNIGDGISQVHQQAKAGDTVYFFFAGHGDIEAKTKENGLLLLYNSPNGNYFGMTDDVLQIMELKTYIQPMAERNIVVVFIIDACHSGNLSGGVEGSSQTSSALMASWGKEYKLLSCQPNQFSQESDVWGKGRGLFSYEFAKGIKGLADGNADGKVSMMELQTYLQQNVFKYSGEQQLPVITGDLTKSFFKVNPATLARLKQEEANTLPKIPDPVDRGRTSVFSDSLDADGKQLYTLFYKKLEEKDLLKSVDSNAYKLFQRFEKKYSGNKVVAEMRTKLAIALSSNFYLIVEPLLTGDKSKVTKEESYLTAVELDSCVSLFEPSHYLYKNLKARKLYMYAVAETWNVEYNEFNISLEPLVERSVKMLEESEGLEPNVAYTAAALGNRYYLIHNYQRAYESFQKYVDLRPNDLIAKYSVAKMFFELKRYDKAIQVLNELQLKWPSNEGILSSLWRCYFELGKFPEALNVIQRLKAMNERRGIRAIGFYYHLRYNMDSALFYYNKATPEAYSNIASV